MNNSKGFDTGDGASDIKTTKRTGGYREAREDGRGERDELAYLVELLGSPPSYWDGRGTDTFSLKHEEAVRFSRKEDAERVRCWIIKPDLKIKCESRQHGWADMPHAHQQAMQEIIEQRDMAGREVNRLSQSMQAAQEANRDLLVKLAAALERIAELETYKAHHKTNLEYIAEICQEITVERRVNSALRERAQGLEVRVRELEKEIEDGLCKALSDPDCCCDGCLKDEAIEKWNEADARADRLQEEIARLKGGGIKHG